jgi:plastocyanin
VREVRVFVLAYALIVALAAPPALLADDGTSSNTSTSSPPGPAEPGLPPGAAGSSASSTPNATSGTTQPSDSQASKKKSSHSKDKASAAGSKTVTIKDFEFTPKSITVNVGDTVNWTNNGPTDHTATSDKGGLWDTGNLKKGSSGSHTFNQAGTFAYHCTPHPFMKATITVADSGGSSSSGGSGSSGTGSTGSSSGTGSTGSTGSSSSSGSGSGKSLAGTGADVLLWAAAGAGLIALGYGLRRRRPRSR